MKFKWTSGVRLGVLAVAFCLVMAGGVRANLVPSGGETLLNITTVSDQIDPVFAVSGNGLYKAAAWMSLDQDGDAYGVFAQFGGVATEVQVNQTSVGSQSLPDVSIGANGRTVLVWTGEDPVETSIFARVFDAAGSPLTPEFRVEALAGYHQAPKVDHFPNGNFAVVWQSSGQTYLRMFDAAGSPISSIQLPSVLPNQSGVDVSVGANTFGVITWRVNLSNEGVYYRTFASTGNWISGVTKASQSSGDFFYGTAASSANGSAFVSWILWNTDGSQSILTREFDSLGNPLTQERKVHDVEVPFLSGLDMSHDNSGRGVLVWDETPGGLDGEIYGLCLNRSEPVGDPVQVNTTMTHRQRNPSVALNELGGIAVAWYTEDGTNGDCHLQDFEFGATTSTGQPEVSALTTLRVSAVPNVFSEGTELRLDLPNPSSVEAQVFDSSGRRVRSLLRSTAPAGRLVHEWDGRDDLGRAVSAGAYWVRFLTSSESRAQIGTVRVVRVR